MKVRIGVPGGIEVVEFPDAGVTAAQAFSWLGIYDSDWEEIRLNGEKIFPDQVMQDGDEVILHPLAMPRGRILDRQEQEGVRQLRSFTAGATDLVIVDPCITNPWEAAGTFARVFADCLDLASGTLKQLHIIYGTRYHNHQVLAAIARMQALWMSFLLEGFQRDPRPDLDKEPN